MDAKQQASRKLVQVTQRLAKLEAADKELRKELLSLLADDESVAVNGVTVRKEMTRKTITDPTELVKNGFDVSRVVVTKTSVDPSLVKTIGQAEGKQYFTVKPTIVCRKA
jgi:hypothetical protein